MREIKFRAWDKKENKMIVGNAPFRGDKNENVAIQHTNDKTKCTCGEPHISYMICHHYDGKPCHVKDESIACNQLHSPVSAPLIENESYPGSQRIYDGVIGTNAPLETGGEWEEEFKRYAETPDYFMKEVKVLPVNIAIGMIHSLLTHTTEQTARTVLQKMQNIVLNSSTEEYTHGANSFLVANTDKIMMAILDELKEYGVSLSEQPTEKK